MRTVDLDIVVEFENINLVKRIFRPVYGPIEGSQRCVHTRVDLVDVHPISPAFARIAFDDGPMSIGDNARREELEATYAGNRPTTADARDRVAAVADRLREDSEAGA